MSTIFHGSSQTNFKLSISQILLITNFMLLLLPLGGIYILRLYENEVIRQTQAELISQAAFIVAIYKDKLKKVPNKEGYGIPLKKYSEQLEYFHPISFDLDLAKDKILPPRPSGLKPSGDPSPVLSKVAQDTIPILIEAQRITLSGMKILDPTGTCIACLHEQGLSFSHLPEFKEASQGRFVSTIRYRSDSDSGIALSSISRRNNINIFFAAPIIQEGRLVGVVLLSRTPKDLNKALYERRGRLMTASILLLILVIAITLFTSITITSPIHQLVKRIESFANGSNLENEQPINYLTMNKEISSLFMSFEQMAKKIDKRSQYIRDFAMYVSHEFKTPITSIQATVELLEEHYDSMKIERRKRFLEVIKKETQRLKQLVSRLLELAKADMLSVSNIESLHLASLLSTLRERYKDFDLTLIYNTHNCSVDIGMNVEVLEIILTNLLNNCLQHGAKHVECLVQPIPSCDHQIGLGLSDDGEGISPANVDKLFIPFFTTKRDSGGTGLGLQITKSLLNAYNGDIKVLNVNKGASFLLILPISSRQIKQ